MQLATLFPDMIIKSTKVVSSAQTLETTASTTLDFTFLKNQDDSRFLGFKNCEKVLKSPAGSLSSKTKLICENFNEFNINYTNKNNEFMDEDYRMTGVNGKRSLQSKSCERKRRRPIASLAADTSSRDDTVATIPTRVRQTRQTAQRSQIFIANISKNKSDNQINVVSSKKLLRSSKLDSANDGDGDEIPDYEDRQTEIRIPLSDSEMTETDIQRNEDEEILNNRYNTKAKHDSKNENLECNKDKDVVDDKALKTHEKTFHDEGTEGTEGEGENDEGNVEGKREQKRVQEINENQNSVDTTHNRNDSSMLPVNEASPSSSFPELHRYETSPPEHPESIYALERERTCKDNVEFNADPEQKEQVILKTNSNEEQHINVESEETNEAQVLEKVDEQLIDSEVLQASCKKILAISTPLVTRTESPTTHFGGFDYETNQEELYENELISNSSSLSSDTSATSSCKTLNDKQDDSPNCSTLEIRNKNQQQQQSKKQQQVFDENKMHTTTPSVYNTQQMSSTSYDRSWCQASASEQQEQEQYNRYDTNENNGCALKPPSPPCSTTPPANILQSSPTTVTKQQLQHQSETINIELNTNFNCVIGEENLSPLRKDSPQKLFTSVGKDDPETNLDRSISVQDIKPSDQYVNDAERLDRARKVGGPDDKQQTNDNDAVQNNKQDIEENVKIRNHQKNEEEQDFDKYLKNSRVQPHTEFDIERNDASHQQHQQHEKDIIDAADKVYTQIEEQQQQYHQQHHVTSSYEHMINNHQRNQQQQHQQQQDHEHHLNHNVQRQQQEHLALITTQHHSMQQHYNSSEQLYQLQQQEQLQHQQHPLQQQMLLHQNTIQEQQQHHLVSQNQTAEHERQLPRSHMMDFLHPQHHTTANTHTHSPLHQHQNQIHEVYHDLMMDEFHDNHNTPYKLGLSPSNEKHENQDDGYETSAGDVLTPNSHVSSTHSVTPHHVQHSVGGLITNPAKCEDQQQQQQQHHTQQLQQKAHNNLHLITKDHNLQQHELRTSDSTANIPTGDPYHFTDDDLHTGNSNGLRNILTPPHSHTRGGGIQETGLGNFMVMQSDGSSANMNTSNDLFVSSNSSASHQHQQVHQQKCTDLNSSTELSCQQQNFTAADQISMLNLHDKPPQKRRGRKKKIPEGGLPLKTSIPNDNIGGIDTVKTKERKKHDRFNGMSEEEVVKRTLPDHLCDNLDIVIIGINPGLFAAYKGHHYAGPGNHFWKCLYLSGLTLEQMNSDEDFKLIKYGIGFTNMVQRATKGSADLTRKEIKEGSRILLEKLQTFRPKIAVFNGKLIFEVFSGKKDFNFGRQPECVEGTDTFIWVMPSSSARCAQLPRAADKVPFYAALKKFRDYLKGLIPHIDEAECVFTEERIKRQCEQENFKNQQNTTNSTASYTNASGINNTHSSADNPHGCSYGPETNPHDLVRGQPGQPGSEINENFMMSPVVAGQHAKKKRGRPKKIKGQDIIDPVTGNKINLNNAHLQNQGGAIDYTNILNLSMVQGAISEIPKKKRGRPKKIKPQPTQFDMLDNTQSSLLTQKPNIMSIQSLTTDLSPGSPQRLGLQSKNLHVALYSTPPHQSQRSIYSPMASPSLNCSYVTTTPPCQLQNDKLGTREHGRESTKTSSTDLVTSHHHQIPDQNMGESTPPSSANECVVDFEPSTATSVASSSNVNEHAAETEMNTLHQRLQNHQSHQRSRYNSPSTDHNTTEHFQQWLSPQHQQNNSPSSAFTNAVFADSSQQQHQSSLHYHDQQQQQMQPLHPQELLAQWPLIHQSHYEDATSSPYLLNSSQLSHTHPHSHHHTNSHQHQHTSSDVARKSISGLESLVDQIPTISESESVALSSAAAVNAQVAAAAAVASRLQGMQNTLTDSQVPDSHYNSSTSPNTLTATTSPPSAVSNINNNNQQLRSSSSSNLLSSNFSVSNLAASSATSNNECYGQTGQNARQPTNTNANAYHHSNLMAAAVLAAAAANSPTNLSTSTAVSATAAAHHAQMYMDPHAHLTPHVPVNSIYPPPTSHHHPATAAQHAAAAHHAAAAAAHYGSAQHTAADYASNPYAAAAAAQNNVNAVHTLHMPSPNYPYGYATASSQSNYSGYPHSHSHHGHPHAQHTAAHHLAMFDRLKHSDIGGYSGF